MIYGRRIGRRLKENQKRRLEEFLGDFQIHVDVDTFTIPKDWHRYIDIQMEVGFGTGTHLALQATKSPTTLFLGCEPFLNGVAALAMEAKENKLQNLRVFLDDALVLLRVLPDAFLSKIFILFPDPWPKKRHNKRRFIQKDSLVLMARKLKPEGRLFIATDHEEYKEWIDEMLVSCPSLCVLSKDDHYPSLWASTRFQEKAEKKGLTPLFFLCKKA